MTDMRTVSGWLTDLANLCGGKPNEMKPKIGGMASMLADNFPFGAFTRQSLEHVARQCNFFPSYAELCNVLAPWWKENRPPTPAIAADQNATIRQRELNRQIRQDWENITAVDVRAKIRAINDSAMPGPFGSFLAAALAKHAPHHLGLLPPVWLKNRSEPADVVAIRQMPAFHDA